MTGEVGVACAAAAAAAVLLVSCSGSDDGASAQRRSAAGQSSESGATSPDGSVDELVDVGDRELHLRCTGAGSPTLVLEGGEGSDYFALEPLRTAYQDSHRVCSYDRANVGRSGPAPAPRSAESLVEDLHSLLTTADVGGPYLLVGQSAGGLLVQAYAREYADELVGVVAVNPVPPWHEWSHRALPVMTRQERRDEAGYYAGANGESLDYRDLSRVVEAARPPHLPFHLLISTRAQCESPGDVCSRTYAAYEAIMRDLSRQWRKGEFSETRAGHDITREDVAAVRAAIDDVLDRVGET